MKNKLIYLVWDDSFSMADWRNTDEQEKFFKSGGLIETVGIYLRENKTYLTICLSLDLETGNVHTLKSIPKVAIKKRKFLKR